MSWTNDYIGIPFRDNGRDRQGVDCYGLVYLVYKERELGLLPRDWCQPHIRAEGKHLIIQLHSSFWKVDEPQDGDIVAFNLHPLHLGIVCGGGNFLHVQLGKCAVVESYEAKLWSKRIRGFYHPGGITI